MSKKVSRLSLAFSLGLLVCAPVAISVQAEQPEVLIAKLRELYAQHISSQRSDTWPPVLQCVDALAASGEAASTPIGLALQQERDQTLQGLLARSLAEMPGETGTRDLLGLYGSRPLLRQPIENAMVSRGKKHGGMGFPLSQVELEPFFERLGEVPAINAPLTAHALATCHANDLTPAVHIILARLLNQIRNPIPSVPHKTALPSSPFPPQVDAIRSFLKALAALPKESVPILTEARKNPESKGTDKWLLLALGYAGDAEVAKPLAEIVRNEDDRYVRAVAIESYARSARREAIPLLEQFEEDPTLSEYGDRTIPDVKILREAARSSIAAIRRGLVR